MITLENIFQKIQSTEYLDQISGLDNLISINEKISTIIIDKLDNAKDRMFIAERIFGIIHSYTSKLLEVARTTDDIDLKFYAYFILLSNDICEGSDFLLDYVSKRKDFENILFVMQRLVNKNVQGIIPIIKTKIDTINMNKDKFRNCDILIETLSKMI